MGAITKDEAAAITELSALSATAKECINHHICNALAPMEWAAQNGRIDIVKRMTDHIIADLERLGLRTTRKDLDCAMAQAYTEVKG